MAAITYLCMTGVINPLKKTDYYPKQNETGLSVGLACAASLCFWWIEIAATIIEFWLKTIVVKRAALADPEAALLRSHQLTSKSSSQHSILTANRWWADLLIDVPSVSRFFFFTMPSSYCSNGRGREASCDQTSSNWNHFQYAAQWASCQ